MHAVRIGDRSLHVEDRGPRDAPTLVFANSLGTDFRVWTPLLPHLPAGLRLVRYDKAGHGLSEDAGQRSIADHADDLAAVFDALEIGRAVLVGLSVGGMIAQAFHAAHRDRVAGLVLCDTAHRIGTPEMWNQRMETIRAGGIASMADPILERWFSAAFRRDRAAELGLWRSMLVRTPVEGYLAACAAIRDADLTAAARAIDVPACCLVGSEDGSTPPDLVRAFAALIPGATFHEVAGAGHLPGVEAPERVGRIVTDFLREHSLA